MEMEMEIYLPIDPFNPTQLINHTQKEKFRSIKKKRNRTNHHHQQHKTKRKKECEQQ